jgi:hypothetical protein
MRCENVVGCGRTASVTVSRFMGSVWLCAECATAETLTVADRTVPVLRVGDVVRVRFRKAVRWGTVVAVSGRRYRVWTPVGTCRRTAHSVSSV